MANIDVSKLIQKVRAESGKPSPKELTDAEIEYFIDDGLAQLIKNVDSAGGSALVSLDFITTVSGQQQYAPGTGKEDVVEVFWNGAQTTGFFDDIPIIPDNQTLLQDSNFASLTLGNDIKIKRFRQGYNAQLINGKVWLCPIPTEGGIKVAFTYRPASSGAKDVSIKYELVIKLWAVIKTLRALAALRSDVANVTRQSMEGYQNADLLRRLADDKQNEWESELSSVTSGSIV